MNKNIRTSFLILLVPLIAWAFGRGPHSISDACYSEKFSEYEKGIEAAFEKLKPWEMRTVGQSGKSRKVRDLASLANQTVEDPQGKVGNLERSDRRYWGNWAEDQLKQTQRFIDLADAEPDHYSARDELTRAANELVAFHGYAVAGETDRMVLVLERIRRHGHKAKQIACEARPAVSTASGSRGTASK